MKGLTLGRFIDGAWVDGLGGSERDEAGDEEGNECVEMHFDFLNERQMSCECGITVYRNTVSIRVNRLEKNHGFVCKAAQEGQWKIVFLHDSRSRKVLGSRPLKLLKRM